MVYDNDITLYHYRIMLLYYHIIDLATAVAVATAASRCCCCCCHSNSSCRFRLPKHRQTFRTDTANSPDRSCRWSCSFVIALFFHASIDLPVIRFAQKLPWLIRGSWNKCPTSVPITELFSLACARKWTLDPWEALIKSVCLKSSGVPRTSGTCHTILYYSILYYTILYYDYDILKYSIM